MTPWLEAAALPLAHVANVEYRFPLPVWLYALAGATAIVGSVPAAAVAVRGGRDRITGNLYPAIRPLRLGRIGLAVASFLVAIMLLSAFFNDAVGFNNAATTLFWVDFWVGLGVVSALIGNVWDYVSPLSAGLRRLDAWLGSRGVAARAYPDVAGVWPAVLLLVVFSWIELAWTDGRDPRTVGTLAMWYVVIQVVGVVRYGAEPWLAHGELFTVFARTLARMAPIETYVETTSEPCAAGRCTPESERRGCPSCWLAAPPDQRGIRLRGYGVGVHREPALGPAGGAFVVVALGTVVYDGLRGTFVYRSVTDPLTSELPGLRTAAGSSFLGAVTLVVVLAAFAAAFAAVIAVVGRLEGSTAREAAQRYSATLIPIAAVYFIAHYFLYLFYIGQLTPAVVFDPLNRGWFRDYRPWTAVSGSLVWVVQALLIVWGHLVAVVEAHRISVRFNPDRRRALLAQTPLVALMVAYTFFGLWVLGQALMAAR